MNSSFLPLNDSLVAGQELDCTNMAPGAEILILQWDGNELQSNPCPNFEVQSAYTGVLWLRLSCFAALTSGKSFTSGSSLYPIATPSCFCSTPQFSSVQSLSRVRLFATPWIAARQASLSITNSRSSLRLTSIESVMPSSHLILCHSLLLLPPIPPSIRVFSNESTLSMRWPKYWSFSFSISPSNEQLGLISFRMDWVDLIAVQGTLKSLFQYHSSKASILQRSAFFYNPTLTSIHDYWKNHSLG